MFRDLENKKRRYFLILPKNDDEFKYILSEINALYTEAEPFEGNIFYYHHQNLRVNKELELKSKDKRKQYEILSRNSQNILEIGVNAGHSALLLLSSNPSVNYKGIDIDFHQYTKKLPKYLVDIFLTDSHLSAEIQA